MPGSWAYSVRALNYRPRFSVVCWPYRAKCSARFLNSFFMEIKLLSVRLRPKPGPGAYPAAVNYRPRFSVARWPYRAKCSARFLKNFFMETKLLSVRLGPKPGPRGIIS